MNCAICSQPIFSLKSYKLHVRMHPDFDDQKLSCLFPKCGRIFQGWNSFNRHILLHEREHNDNMGDVNLSENVQADVDENIEEVLNVNVLEPEITIEIGEVQMEFNNKLENKICAELDSFIAKLYSNPKLPRSLVQSVIGDVHNLVCNVIMSDFKTRLTSAIANIDISPQQTAEINSVFETVQDSFSSVSTEHLIFKKFFNNQCYIPPKPYKLGTTDVRSKGRLIKKIEYGQYIPLDQLFKKVFETMPDTLDIVLSYIKSFEEDPNNIENYMQCNQWQLKKSRYNSDDIVLPLFPYYDDAQYNNPLGSHAEKFGGVYLSLPFLPPECRSRVENIFLASLFKTSARAIFGDKKVFHPLLQELKSLEQNGVLVETISGVKRVYFVSALLLGDNLGLNSVGGFVECFSANYFCRFCKTCRDVTLTQTIEDVSTLRDEIDYNEDLNVNDSSITGVKKDCIFNTLKSFHITTNYCVDSFHDIAEGVCHYVMLEVLKHCVPKYFNIDFLNNRIRLFDLGPCESNTIPFLLNDFASKSKLKMSGSETILFCKVFGLLVGDRVPSTDKYWLLYLKMRHLMDIIFSKSLTLNQAKSLSLVVDEFNSMCVNVTNDTLKPKFHFLVHYLRMFLESGPFEGMSTKRCESKHRDLVIPARATMSRKNPILTLAIKNQLKLCFRLMSSKSILNANVLGPGDVVNLHDFVNYKKIVRKLPDFVSKDLSCFSPNWMELNGNRYKPGMVLLVDVQDFPGPIFHQIELILAPDASNYIFITSHLVNLGFNAHVHSYQVEATSTLHCIHLNKVYDSLPLYAHNIDGAYYVTLRYAL